MRKYVLMILFFSAVSQAQVAPVQSVYNSWTGGKNVVWQTSDHTGFRYTEELKLKIEQNQITQTSVCTYLDGTELRASVTAKAKITSNSIEILEAKNAIQKNSDDAGVCSASLPKAILNYSFNGNDLVLTNPETQGGIEVVLDTDSK